MLKVAINGACGKMGQRLIALAHESDAFKVTAAIEPADHPLQGKDIGIIAGIGQIDVLVTPEPTEKPDVIIDFSTPPGTLEAIRYCLENAVPLVVGTTGLAKEHTGLLEKLAKKAPILIGSNMSLGMNLMFKLVADVAAKLGSEYDLEIVETHHRFKRDAPSGTALSLAQAIAQARNIPYPDCLVHGRDGKEQLRQPNTIGMHAIRAGDTVGEHSAIFAALGETVELRHTAHTRDTFARGALHAAHWLPKKTPATYTMADVLKLT